MHHQQHRLLPLELQTSYINWQQEKAFIPMQWVIDWWVQSVAEGSLAQPSSPPWELGKLQSYVLPQNGGWAIEAVCQGQGWLRECYVQLLFGHVSKIFLKNASEKGEMAIFIYELNLNRLSWSKAKELLLPQVFPHAEFQKPEFQKNSVSVIAL